MKTEKILKSNTEQATAAWIDYLNQIRIRNLITSLEGQKLNLADALKSIDFSFKKIQNEIIDRNRGGEKGMHGFIAEIAECGIGNARERIKGNEDIYTWINDNSPTDLIKNGIEFQQKFVNSGGHLSLEAIKQHLEKYPEYIKNGGKYQIPKDHYDKIMELKTMPSDIANKMPTSDEFSLRQWKEVKAFFENEGFDIEDLEPSKLEYKQVQKNVIADTLENEKKSLKEESKEIDSAAYEKSKPSLDEGLKAAAVSAVIEGGTTFVFEVSKKVKNGKSINKFTSDDWLEIANKTGVSFGKGGIRGTTIYTLTNFTATPAAVANAITTTSFGIADLVYKYNNNSISENELYEDSQILCLNATISALSSFIGQAVIPVPVVGAVIGNTLGTMMYQIAKDNFNEKDEKLLFEFANSLKELDVKLEKDYQELIEKLNKDFEIYLNLIERAFAPNINLAFESSAHLAKHLGIPQSEIIDSKEKLFDYFLE